MANDKTILTVSYGAFSCTLEGFDDPLAAMKDVVAYFRDLSVEDERFGIEPLASASGLLPYLAAHGHTGPIDAEAAMGGLRLRRVPDSADACSDAYDDDDEPPARGPAVASAGTAPETVAAKLARIRGVVARSRGGVVGAAFADTVPPVATAADDTAEAGDDEQTATAAPAHEPAAPDHDDHDVATDPAAEAPEPDLATEETVETQEDAADEVAEVATDFPGEDIVAAEQPVDETFEDSVEDPGQAAWDVPPEDESDIAGLAALDAAPHDPRYDPAEAEDTAEPAAATATQDSLADEPAEAPDELAALIARLNREAAASARDDADEAQPAPAEDDASRDFDEETQDAAAAAPEADDIPPHDAEAETDDDLPHGEAADDPAHPVAFQTAHEDEDTADFTADADGPGADFAGRPMARVVVMRKVDHDAAIATGRLDPMAAVTDDDAEPADIEADATAEAAGDDGTEAFRLDQSARVEEDDAEAHRTDDSQAVDAELEAFSETDPEHAEDSGYTEAADDTDDSLLLDASMAVMEDVDNASSDEAAAGPPVAEADAAAPEAEHSEAEHAEAEHSEAEHAEADDTGGSLLLEPAMAVGDTDDDTEPDDASIDTGIAAAEVPDTGAETLDGAEDPDAARMADADPSTAESGDDTTPDDAAIETEAEETTAAGVPDSEEPDAALLTDADPSTAETGDGATWDDAAIETEAEEASTAGVPDSEEPDAALLADADPSTAESGDETSPHDDTGEREPERSPARGGATSALPTGDEAVDRILAETNHQLEDSESSRRRDAIAHLKAAVAAARAAPTRERDAKIVGPSNPEVQFRDDFARVVRPRRPAEDGTATQRRMPPLLLVSEQRIDVPEQEPPAVSDHPVRPRRVSTHQIELESESEPEVEAGASGPAFADFAASVGARNLPDIMEAAASYYAFVEGQPHFSRPQIMKTAAEAAHDEVTREDQLRSFGILLRQGRIQKLQRGQFAVTDKTRFRPEQRHVGE